MHLNKLKTGSFRYSGWGASGARASARAGGRVYRRDVSVVLDLVRVLRLLRDTVGTQTTDVSRGDYSCSGEFLPELFSFLMTAPELKRIRLAFLGGALVALCFMLVTEEDDD